jgi:glutathione synthase/RimK-type ligase-like ATP-grasp enzyme
LFVSTLIVVNDPKNWPFDIPSVELVDAWSYLTQSEFSNRKNVKLFNLCRSYGYQSLGYYVSLLAEARGHKPIPSVSTVQDMKSQAMVRFVSEDLEDLIQESLAPIHSDRFTLSVYFGRNMTRRYDRLCLRLFNMFQSPMLRVQFAKEKSETWHIRSIATISGDEVPESHRPFLLEMATEHFAGRTSRVRKKAHARYDLAILQNEEEANPPSNEKALKKFIKAAEQLGMDAEIIGRDDYGRLAEFDALFIRETTAVNHHTYRFARRAASEGLIVMDDPESIVRCGNKVFLAEMLACHHVPMPKSLVVHKENINKVVEELGLPCVLKQPDSAFSLGVVKAESAEQLEEHLEKLLDESELIVAQEYLPTTFDWRIGILDGKPLYACKYFMARNHWQIIKRDENGEPDYGRFETLPVELAPRAAVRAALKAASYIGNGLYGVDVKQSGDKFYVIEVNDNPSIDAGVEDQILRDELYNRIMSVFLHRIEQRKSSSAQASSR